MPRKPVTPAPATTGARIKAARERVGLTQAELAAKVDLATQTISAIERDVFEPSAAALRRISDVVRVPRSKLLAD